MPSANAFYQHRLPAYALISFIFYPGLVDGTTQMIPLFICSANPY